MTTMLLTKAYRYNRLIIFFFKIPIVQKLINDKVYPIKITLMLSANDLLQQSYYN